MNDMIPKGFREQYIECENAGFHAIGEVKKLKDHPEILPAPWHRAAKIVAKNLEEDPEFCLSPILCLRFGGECNGGHSECQKLRGFKKLTKT